VSIEKSEPVKQPAVSSVEQKPVEEIFQKKTAEQQKPVQQKIVQQIDVIAPVAQEFFTNEPVVKAPVQPDKNTYEQLLALWSVDASASNQKSFCLMAEINNLRCKIEKNIDLNSLSEINRPGLVTVLGDQDTLSLYMVSFFDGYNISLTNSSGSTSMLARDFADVWDGRFVYIWRPPSEFARTLYPDVRDSKMTRWAQEKLQIVFEDYEYVIGGGIYSQPIVRAIARFQTQQGLEADGLLGPRTILRLMDQTENLPRLDQPESLNKPGAF